MNYRLPSQILRGAWAIDPSAAMTYFPIIQNILGSGPVQFEFDKSSFDIVFQNRTTGAREIVAADSSTGTPATMHNIAIVPLYGPLMKHDQECGPVGMETIGNVIKSLDRSPNVDGIILKIDSPGGTVDGTEALSKIVADTKKPILAFADGLMASAAVWIGSSADETIAAGNKTEIGSIGVMMSFADVQPYYEKMGVKFHTILAEQSKDKNMDFMNLKAGKYDDFKKEVLNPLAEDFIAHMKSTRPNVTEDQLTGKVFFAEDLLGTLVDSIGSLDDAIARVSEMITESEQSGQTKPSNTMNYTKINAAIGAELQTTAEGAFLNKEQLEAIENGMAEAKAEDPKEDPEDEDTKEEPVSEDPKEEPAEEDPKEEPSAADPRDARIAQLEAQVKSLENSAASDPDVAKSTDKGKSSTIDNYSSAVAEAREMMDYLNQ